MIVFAASKQMNNNGKLKKLKLNKINKPIYDVINKKSIDELAKFFKIKNDTLNITYDYYNSDKVIFNKAIDCYEGISFRQITCRKNLENLYIISAFNSIVRSDYEIFNYRLDFTNKIFDEYNLYKYHKDNIIKVINKNEDKYLLNLASAEYYKAIDINSINKIVIDIKVMNKADSVSLKKMRGQLVNYCLEKNIKDYTKIRNFDNELFSATYKDKCIEVTFKEL